MEMKGTLNCGQSLIKGTLNLGQSLMKGTLNLGQSLLKTIPKPKKNQDP